MISIKVLVRVLVAVQVFVLARLIITGIAVFYPNAVLVLLGLPSTHDLIEYAFVSSVLSFAARDLLYGWFYRWWRGVWSLEVPDVDEA